MNPLNDTTTRVPLRITLSPAAHWKWQILTSLDDSMSKSALAAGGSGGEMDELKRILTHGNPFLLGTTVIMSILHMM